MFIKNYTYFRTKVYYLFYIIRNTDVAINHHNAVTAPYFILYLFVKLQLT